MKSQFGFATVLAIISVATVAPATAQESASTNIGGARVSAGGGIAILTLPDIPTMLTRTTNTAPFTVFESYKFSDDFGSEVGWNVNAEVAVPVDGSFNGLVDEVALKGFWANIDDTDSISCTGAVAPQVNCLVAPLVDDPAVRQIGGTLGVNSITGDATRDVDQWGLSLESKNFLGADAEDTVFTSRYFAFGADVRGIYQDINSALRGTTGTSINYNEDLDTTYYGAFVAVGSDVKPFLFKGLWESLGLQSSVRLQGGVYYANTEYDGTLTHTAPFPGGGGDPSGSLSLSSDDAAFIGGLSLETRKQVGQRVMLSLKSEYEYYSWVPKMIYNNTDAGPVFNIATPERQNGTIIDHDDAFSARTMLRLTVGLGPDDLYR